MGTLMTKSIELTGQSSSNSSMTTAIEQFAELFHCRIEDVQRIVDKAPIIIKEGLSDEKAQKLKTLIDGTGLECILLDDQVEPFEEVSDSHADYSEHEEPCATLITQKPSFATRVKSWFGR